VRYTSTTTLPNGSVAIVTATSYVGVDPTPTDPSSPNNTPDLQDDSSYKERGNMGLVAGLSAALGLLLMV
jgi:hypothetical protein